MVNPKRIDFIDIAKGIAIFLVVLGHTYRGTNLNLFIYSFHMPVFFFISGLLFNENKYTNLVALLKNRARTLLLPYTTFYIITYFYWFFVEKYIRPGYNIDFKIPIIGFFYGNDVEKYMCPNGVLWFLVCLFVTEILLYLVLKFKNTKIRALIFILSAIAGYLFSLLKTTPPPLSSGTALVALLFTGAGFLSKNYVFTELPKLKRNFAFVLSVILFVAVYFIALNNGKITMVYMDYQNPVLFILTAFLGIIACLIFSYSITKSSIIQFFGINSLIFVGLSEPIKRALLGVFSKVLHYPMDELRASVIMSIIVVMVCFIVFIPIIYVFNRYLYLGIGKQSSSKQLF